MMRRGFTLIEISAVVAIIAILLGLVLANLRTGRLNTQLRISADQLIDDIRSTQNMSLVGTTIPVCRSVDPSDATQITFREDCQLGAACFLAGYTCTAVQAPGGYGVFFDKALQDRYTIFGDYGFANRDGQALSPVVYSSTGDTIVRMVPLPEGIIVDKIRITGQFDSPQDLPAGKTCIAKGASLTYYPTGPNANLNSSISLAWVLPKGRMYANVINQNLTYAYGAPYDAGQYASCPDYLLTIQLKQTLTGACRVVTVNGASGLVEDSTNTACTL